MRNAAATFDDDFGYEEPRKKAPRKPRAASSKPKARKTKARRFGFDIIKVARYAAIGMSATVAVGIMVNALVLQKGHHPAPLFGKAIALPDQNPIGNAAPTTTRDVAMTPSAASRLATPVASPLAAAKPRHGAVVADRGPADRESADKDSANKNVGDDAIAKLLRGGSPPSPSADKGETKTVLTAQKALAKLGFSLKPNGTMGPATHKAIEAFEKSHNLPVKGDLSRRLVKILSAESGVKID